MAFKGLCCWQLLWGKEGRRWSAPAAVLLWLSCCPQRPLSNRHPLCVHVNQARSPFFPPPVRGFMKCCPASFVHLFHSHFGRCFLVAWNSLEAIIKKLFLAVDQCYSSWHFKNKMSAVLGYQWCRIPCTLYLPPWLGQVGKRRAGPNARCSLAPHGRGFSGGRAFPQGRPEPFAQRWQVEAWCRWSRVYLPLPLAYGQVARTPGRRPCARACFSPPPLCVERSPIGVVRSGGDCRRGWGSEVGVLPGRALNALLSRYF